MKIFFLTIAILFSVASVPTYAQAVERQGLTESSATFQKGCRDIVSPEKAIASQVSPEYVARVFNDGYCVGFLNGFLSYVDDDPVLACIPKGVTIEQVFKIFDKYLRDHPEDLHRKPYNVLHVSLAQAFIAECGKDK